MKLTQKQFDDLVETLNHRVTKLEISARWIKWIVGYMALMITTIAVKAIL